MGLVSECDDFLRKIQDQNFISYTIKMLHCCHGVVLVTTRDYQLNVNLFIPRTDSDSEHLYTWMSERLRRDFIDFGIDLRPILRFVGCPPPHVWYRTFLPSIERINDLRLDVKNNVIIFEDYVTPVVEIITDVQRVSLYRPVRRMGSFDPVETLYWHRFECGAIVAFRNPQVELHECYAYPTSDNLKLRSTTLITSFLTPICKKITLALEPQNAAELIDIIQMEHITVEVRRVFVGLHRSRFGFSDDLIKAVGNHMNGTKQSKMLMIAELSIVYDSMRQFVSESPHYIRILEGLMNWLEHFQSNDLWERWIISSPFMHALIRSIETEPIRRICIRFPTIRNLVAASLCTIHPDPKKWKRETTERAHMICNQSGTGGKFVESLRCLYEDWTLSHMRVCNELSTEINNKMDVVVTPSVQHISPESCVITPDAVTKDYTYPVTVQTHDGLVERIASDVLLGRYECTLIGSGIFYNGSDIDIVVHVPDTDTLEDAYDVVQQLTGWEKQYDRISTEHIAVLKGEFDGIRVDAQIWRGIHSSLERTRAEEETHRALTLTRTLIQKTDARLRRMVNEFHGYMSRLGLKGHLLCRLPGVAVTCMAIAIARTDGVTCIQTLMGRVRMHMETDIPYFHLDSDNDVPPKYKSRPTCSVQVIVNEVNVASRITAATTRHLLDTIAWSLYEPTASVRAWRMRNMITCLRMRPNENIERTVALTLHGSMTKMDGHPLIETAFADEHPETRDILIRVTLRRCTRYGFKGTETISRISGTESVVTVSRGTGTRSWMLCTHPCKFAPTSIAACVADVNDELFVRVDGDLCVPNAPHLMCDLMGYFDTRHWMRLDT